MSSKSFKRFIPAFIPIIFEVLRHFRRDLSHNSNIKKFDKNQEKIATIEHLMVKMEKKMITQREQTRVFQSRIVWWLAINSALLAAILIKLFFL